MGTNGSLPKRKGLSNEELKTLLSEAHSTIASLNIDNAELTRRNVALSQENEDQARRILELEETHSRIKQEAIELELQATTCSLTGAQNRLAFERFTSSISEHVAQHQYSGKGVVVALDLDKFKPVNDTHGHKAGDVVLKEMVKRFHEFIERLMEVELSHCDLKLFRIGGDEFVLTVLDRRHDQDRRQSSQDGLKIERRIDGEEHPDRRQMSFEEFVQKSIRTAIDAIAAKRINVPSKRDGIAEVTVGISEGYGYFEDATPENLGAALLDADTESYIRKSGIDEVLSFYENPDLSDEMRDFLENVIALNFDEEVRGGYDIDRDIGVAALALHPKFLELKEQMSPRGYNWLFPENDARTAQAPIQIDR